MNVPLGIEGRALNSQQSQHFVRVENDSLNTGGYLIYERWLDLNGPNALGTFDSWVESEAQLKQFFIEAVWEVAWQP